MNSKMLPIVFLLLLTVQSAATQEPAVVHSRIGQTAQSSDNAIKLTLLHKFQSFSAAEHDTYDTDIHSPKSVNIHPNGKKFYVNSLEGFCTVVYEMGTWRKLKVVRHQFDDHHASLWAPPCGFFPFTHYSAQERSLNTFSGKPVESSFSHGGRYLWVPYYRRSYDINAQDPSAMAVIDTRNDTIIRLFETGPLPKMVARSSDGTMIAVSHWGDNTVATLDISSDDPADWHYTQLYIVDYQLKLNFSLSQSVDRDNGSGYALRGTVFTPDDHYLLVGCMGGSGGIAVIDLQEQKYLGRMLGMRANIRHLVIRNDTLYLSSNAAGVVQRMALSQFLDAAQQLREHSSASVTGWEECKVMGGCRTIELTPNGRYIFAACNAGSHLCVADTRTMSMIASTVVDSYPVGLDMSADGSIVIVTSQGRSGTGGGNAVNIFGVESDSPLVPPAEPQDTLQQDSVPAPVEQPVEQTNSSVPWKLIAIGAAALLLLVLCIIFVIRRKK